MKSASKKTYISLNQLKKYNEKKSHSEKVEGKKFAEDEEEKKGIEKIIEEKSEDEYSEEEVDSDDMGDTLEQKKAQSQQVEQQQMKQQFLQQQNIMINQQMPQIQSLQQIQPQQQMQQMQLQQQPQKKAKKQPMKKQMKSAMQVPQQQLEQQQQLLIQPQQQIQQQPQQFIQTQAIYKPSNKKYKEQIDTNVFNIELGVIADENVQLATGDPIFCKQCEAVFSIQSSIQNNIWICEFCNYKNDINIDPEEMPKNEAINYILQAAPQKKEAQKQEIGDQTVIFCVDVSGSMSGQRLDYIKKALQAKIKDMYNCEEKNCKVGILLFESKVYIQGDGTKSDVTINKTDDYNFLMKNGIANSNLIQTPLKNSFNNLSTKIDQMKPMGGTALGPGLLTAVAMAGEGTPGSVVILCTDGMANEGLGRIGSFRIGQEQNYQDDFYDRVAEYASSKGVMVNIISFSGAESNVQILSRVPDITGGSVEMIDLGNKQNVYQNMNMKIIATNVELKIKLHKGLEFRNEDPSLIDKNKNIYNKRLGNITSLTEMTFEYRLKPVKQLLQIQDIDFSQLKQIPFQVQIKYQTLQGAKCMRIITQSLEVSSEKEELQKEADLEILGLNAIQQTSNLAKKGDIRQAQAKAKAWDNVMKKNETEVNNEQFKNYKNSMGQVYNALNQQYRVESNINPYQGQKKMRSQQSDQVSQQLYMGSKITKAKMRKGD